ncbi:MAG: hypothetical protein K1X68_05910 [Saprospiraceae bacterium]|nr:hypothetical protein [Saprospiraceae bacterium]HMW38776.1 hypothetical protein [Saprospiraceae bacterium]HMX88685.1 hypothetical protein [Saprospiraceae bacterium]HMZ40117.1 hypothetical protein [Saprospiraceae bacterium]HNB29648.1 hypothetical protein [Saprospiraceae bacterium]
MKNQIDLQLLVFSFLILFMFSCCQNEDPCPTCFKDIVRCKVNGKEWVSNCASNDPLFGCNSIKTKYNNDPPFFEFLAFNDKLGDGFHLISRSSFKLLDTVNQYNYERSYYNKNKIDDCHGFSIDTSVGFFIIKKFDSNSRIIKGEFEFECFNNCKDTISISDGYFALSY